MGLTQVNQALVLWENHQDLFKMNLEQGLELQLEAEQQHLGKVREMDKI